jgi:plastocyanin
MRRKALLALVMIALTTALSVSVKVQKVKAATQSFTLYGSASAGWGFTPSTMTSPGPTISVTQGDLVNLTLKSEDGLSHKFFVDYNGNGALDSGEPTSPSFGATPINFQFTADKNGTFTYYCSFHPGIMYGTFHVTQAVPEFQSFIIVPLFIIATSLGVIIYRKKCSRATS